MNNISVKNILLVAGFYLAFIRGTAINLFYPSDEQLLSSIDYTFQTSLNYLLFVMLVAYFFLQNNYIMLKKILSDPKTLLIVSICILSIVLSIDKVKAIKFSLTVLVISMFPALYYLERGGEALIKAVNRFIIPMCLCNLAYILAMPEYGIMTNEHAGAWRGLFSHKNDAGPFFAISFFFLLHQFRKSAIFSRFVIAACMVICVLLVFLSNSSTAAVSFLFLTIIYTAMLTILRFRHVGERIGILLLLLSTILLGWVFLGDAIMNLFFMATGKDATLTGRTAIWEAILGLIHERPILGYGLGLAQDPEFMSLIHGQITFEAKSSHNSFLDLMVNLGYPGMIFFSLLILRQLIRALTGHGLVNESRRQLALAFAVIATALIISFTTADILIGRSAFWMFTLLSMMMCSFAMAEHRHVKWQKDPMQEDTEIPKV